MSDIEEFKRHFSRQKGVSKATIRCYSKDVSRFMAWFELSVGEMYVPQAVRREHIVQYLDTHAVSPASKQRYLSSLRRFFHFLTAQGVLALSPLEKSKRSEPLVEKWQLHEFAHYLHISHASALTIKYYLLDIKHFLRWMEQEKGTASVRLQLIEEYMRFLVREQQYSRATVHRKQAAVRKYLVWYIR